jgi:hypothetical protein
MTGAVGLRPILGEFVVSDTPQAEAAAAPQRCCFSGTAARPPRPQERINRPRALQRRRVREGFSSSATGTVLSPSRRTQQHRQAPSPAPNKHPARRGGRRLPRGHTFKPGRDLHVTTPGAPIHPSHGTRGHVRCTPNRDHGRPCPDCSGAPSVALFSLPAVKS